MLRLLILSALLLGSGTASAIETCLLAAIDATRGSTSLAAPLVLSTRNAAGDAVTHVLGAPRAGQPLPTGREGFRTASITKSFVAAAALRLHEDGRLDLDRSIDHWLPPAWHSLLRAEGYDTARITPRQLLSHTAGLADHTRTPQFMQAVKAERGGVWSRDRVLQALADWTAPIAAPGERYEYSDTGYVLLGHIIEQISGQPLPQAVRDLLDYDALGLANTWWEQQAPDSGRERAHQWFEGLDTHDWNASMDLYGGGGLVQDTADMARFFEALLQGRVFRRPETLALMRSREGLPAGTPYALGLLHFEFDGVAAIGHSGFWGTLAMHAPASGHSIAGAVSDRADYPQLQAIIARYLQLSAAVPAGHRCDTGAAKLSDHTPAAMPWRRSPSDVRRPELRFRSVAPGRLYRVDAVSPHRSA